ncbi:MULTISPECIES: carbon storage regulator [Pseudomonas]|uniref:Carbon storage regulator n=1 Tax=Pseudomonas nitroreducens TaxID=46680 RepID=A0A5R8ZTZ2_PSENT|nr:MULTISPECIES: carbon storage regulator [Pseudomonas]MBD9629957.1 carbon storage regulator [Pseudomonas sp. PDM19]MBD9684147.1 carbon storage regulator [Pseudomonas sp. PDM20]TLP69832.1 carbon storage regulator [Pseudomonas nitroreducens]
MLNLTRSVRKTIRTGDDIKILILQIRGIQVYVGISAPPEITVHREEVYQRIRQSF